MHKFFQNVWSVFRWKIVRNMSEYVTLCALILRNENWQDNWPPPLSKTRKHQTLQNFFDITNKFKRLPLPAGYVKKVKILIKYMFFLLSQ